MVRFLVESGACLFASTLSDHETPAEKCEEDEEGFDGCSEYLYSEFELLLVFVTNTSLLFIAQLFSASQAFKRSSAFFTVERSSLSSHTMLNNKTSLSLVSTTSWRSYVRVTRLNANGGGQETKPVTRAMCLGISLEWVYATHHFNDMYFDADFFFSTVVSTHRSVESKFQWITFNPKIHSEAH